MRRTVVSLLSAGMLAALLPLASTTATASPVAAPARETEAVVLTGAQLPGWSGVAARGMAAPFPSGGNSDNPISDQKRDAHNGTIIPVPAEAQTGVDPDSVAAYRWDGENFVEIPVQVDERFPYFLANGHSDFGFYSYTDEELSYEWDEESWMKLAGECEATFPDPDFVRTEDPVLTLDDDDEIALMASDAGPMAPLEAEGPAGTGEQRQEIRLVDPSDPANVRFVYLFTREGGSSFTKDNGYVSYERDANADEWIDRYTFTDTDPEKLGTSNTGYGPNEPGTVCTPDQRDPATPLPRQTSDRFPRDGVTVTTEKYRWYASGRWMVREMRVRKPDGSGYGPDLIDRWKGRAFQQTPDASISLVGFEDEQVNWEANSALLGELAGPVRAIREVWGADSGTNVTKTETFYRDAITYRYRVRVHPIPPDGLYTSWDYNHDVAAVYFNETKTEGVAIDGQPDEIPQTQVDRTPTGQNFYTDLPDPTFTKPLSFFNWEQVSGREDAGSLVYMFEFKNAQALQNPLVMPYYRDDACFDDGTGDNPTARPMPGDSTDSIPGYSDLPCYGDPANSDGTNTYSTTATEYRQGCFACHGIHYFITGDTDNAFTPLPLTEIDGQQWQWAVPTEAPRNVGDAYANTVKTPLVPIVNVQPNAPGEGDVDPEEPAPTRLEISGATAGQTTDASTLSATLSTDDGPVAGAEISFSLDGKDVGTAITDGSGVASIEVQLDGEARDVVQTASFEGTEELAASTGSAPFEIQLEDSSTTLTVTRRAASIEANAALTDADSGAPVEGRTIAFYLNGIQVASAVTDASGTATVTFGPQQAKSDDEVVAAFGGDGTFIQSSARGTVPKNLGGL